MGSAQVTAQTNVCLELRHPGVLPEALRSGCSGRVNAVTCQQCLPGKSGVGLVMSQMMKPKSREIIRARSGGDEGGSSESEQARAEIRSGVNSVDSQCCHCNGICAMIWISRPRFHCNLSSTRRPCAHHLACVNWSTTFSLQREWASAADLAVGGGDDLHAMHRHRIRHRIGKP